MDVLGVCWDADGFLLMDDAASGFEEYYGLLSWTGVHLVDVLMVVSPDAIEGSVLYVWKCRNVEGHGGA